MGTSETMSIEAGGHWGKMGNLGLMGTRKNEHQSKSAIEANGHFGTDRHWGKWPPGKMSTKANGHWAIGANEHFGQMGVWVKW